MKKRIISVTLILIMVLGMIQWSAIPAKAAESMDLIWPCASSSAYRVSCIYYYKQSYKNTHCDEEAGDSCPHHSCRYGYLHGIDITGGGDIVAAAAGTVEEVKYQENGFGNYIVIKHSNGQRTLYAHLKSTSVSAGEVVSQGHKIGVMGNTGNSSGTHLHFEYSGADPFRTFYKDKYYSKISFDSNCYSNNKTFNSDTFICNWISKYYTYSGDVYVWNGTAPVIITHTVDSSYTTNFTAYPKAKITAQNIFDANHNPISSSAWIGTSDLCTIHEVYTDGCCKVTYPLDSGSTRTVYSKISLFSVLSPKIRYWISDTEYGDTPSEYKAGNRYYFCYKFYDATTGKNWDEIENSNYTFTLTFYNPDGSVKYTNQSTFDYDQSWISSFFSEPGTYTAKIVMSGDYTFEGTRTFTVQDNPIQVNCSTNSVSLKLGETESQTIYVGYSGYYNGNWSISCSRSNSNVDCTWGDWDDDHRCPLTITANAVGTTNVTIYIKDTDTGKIQDSTTVAVDVRAKTYTVDYNANGGTGAPFAQTKQHDVTLTLSTTIPEYFPYNFMGWESSQGKSYEPGGIYTKNESTEMTAEWGSPDDIEMDYHDGYGLNYAPIPWGGYSWTYYFSPEISTYYRFMGDDDEDNMIILRDEAGNILATDDDSGGNRQFELEYYLEADELYFITVKKYSSSQTGDVVFVTFSGFNVTYDANGGKNAPAPARWYIDEGYMFSHDMPTRVGYAFLGWSLKADATEPEFYPGEDFDIPMDVTLYAVWSPLPYLFYGDLNQDRTVTLTDVNIISKYLNGTYTPAYDTKEFLLRADLDHDGVITENDKKLINDLKLAQLTQEEIEEGCIDVRISALPETEYVLGQEYDTDGLTLLLDFGTHAYPITEDLSVSGYNPGALGEQKITVTFYQYSASYTITVHPEEAPILYGDVNGDGNVNTKDRMVLTRYLAGMTGYTADMIDMKAADVNCDGTVNAKDRMILTRYLAQWTAYPELPHRA